MKNDRYNNNTRRIKAEIWEIQVLLYWLLSLALFETGHPIFGWIALGWSVFTFLGILVLHQKIRIEEPI